MATTLTLRRAATIVALVGGVVVAPPPAAAHPPLSAADYAWVNPPGGVVTTAPPAVGRAVTLDASLVAGGRADVWTPDVQALVSVSTTAPVHVVLEPMDAATFPQVAGLVAAGNAYLIELDGDFSDAQVVLRPPGPVTTVAVWDGASWQTTDVRTGPGGEVTARWTGPGPYLAATHRLDGHASTIGAIVHDPLRTALAAVGFLALALGVQRRSVKRAPPIPR